MAIRVKIHGSEKIIREIDIDKASVRDLLKALELTISEYIVLRNNIVLTEEDTVENGDEITIIPVKSGG